MSLFTSSVLPWSLFIWSNTDVNYKCKNIFKKSCLKICINYTVEIMDSNRIKDSVKLMVAVLVPSVAAVMNVLN